MLTVGKINKLVEQHGLSIKIVDFPTKNQDHHFWYDGFVAAVSKDNTQIMIAALGNKWDVIVVKDNVYYDIKYDLESDMYSEVLEHVIQNFDDIASYAKEKEEVA